METLKELLKPVLRDSFGGVLYNVANRGKYDTEAILSAWNSLGDQERSAAGGIVQGAINFIKGN